MPEPPHFRRILILWAALSIIATPIVVLVWAPGLPPGNGSNVASGQVTDNAVLLGVVTPIAALMIVFFAYALIVFRRRDEGPEEGLAIREDRGIQTTWLAATSVIVLFLATYGTIRLFDEGAGGGQGADPVAKPSGSVLPVQVIAQQWAFTFRYPTFGGVETPHLAAPGRPEHRAARHLARRDPLVLGARPRGEGRRQSGGRQRRLRAPQRGPQLLDSLRRALRALPRAHVRHRRGDERRRASSPGSTAQQAAFGPATGALPKFRSHYNPAPHRRAG